MSLPDAFLTRPLAHRALHDMRDGRPENSRAAIRAAIAAGVGIEIDLQRSADNQAMVFHDYTLDRLTDASGPVNELPAADLQRISLTGGDECIPTLEEVLELVAGQVPLLIELKDQDGQMGPGVGALESATARALADYEGPVAVMSFNPHSVAEFAVLAPQIARGLTTGGFDPQDWPKLGESICDLLRPIPDFDRVGASFISHDFRDLNAARVLALKEAGVPVLCWTIRTSAEEAAAREVADNVTFEGYLP
ncbi:glycerophosphodiester phosphodiesterase family protein [Marinovum sp. 2_MG-2023]|uniref:glycerophosphodiester phosphodiesterase family protein n=1 Tax=unclassified Marinovum TaxID=2647166 RepID=UPI0026E1F858|nr:MULTISPECIES: glycerophosphodiester phosphodiesterase family protein [unclassified Marinovum]MDO6729682.1 glycerophosphodiester phosphodiesterase family protein [Marinovum sp. 2_MG-2023]MDO6779496.1 glycerophosphodiester phosphodiesterase family protein [Marinovum sp. 1_MG-2023]